ncbi:hypothetical protein NO004_530023 [Flavobacterium psychrophilum]|uniref:hypothetical protein n=1 Tax=Flavobacterium psychrophilum TaxID=96345 RepID=UPI000B7C19CF|nr:hypothetical protein [Flavobacterium psychrophilum]SNB29763.1 hypothetical protein NO004_530023 [Flavobacterium psychrophilum]
MIFILSASIMILLFFLRKANEEKEDKDREHMKELEKLRDFKYNPFLEKQHIHLNSLYSMIANNYDRFRINDSKANYIWIDFYGNMENFCVYTKVEFYLSYSETIQSEMVISGIREKKKIKIHLIGNNEFLYNEIKNYY